MRLNDTGIVLATAAQYLIALNDAVRMWSGRVLIPHLYEFDFTSGVREYALPSYIHPPVQVQIRTTTYGYGLLSGDDTLSTFVDFNNYMLEPDGTGGFALRFQASPYAESGQIIWWQENGPVPTVAATSAAGTLAADATSVGIITSPDINDSGIIKINDEIMAYHGATRTSSIITTLGNLRRGLYGTVAASHSASQAVLWCVGVDDQRLWVQLYDQISANVHLYNLHKSTTEDMGRHEKLYSAMQARADNFWKVQGYTPQRAPRFILHRSAMGQ